MKLKKQTVQAFILLARACEHLDFGVDQDITLPNVENLIELMDDPNVKAFEGYLSELSEQEKAELTALFWLGSDPQIQPEDWEDLVENALRISSNDLSRASKRKLPQIMRYAMERLARFRRAQKQSSIVQTLSDEEVARQEQVIGQFTLHAFKERYGSITGVKKLVDIMDHKGFLDDAHDRKLFGLTARERDGFEHVLMGASTKRSHED